MSTISLCRNACRGVIFQSGLNHMRELRRFEPPTMATSARPTSDRLRRPIHSWLTTLYWNASAHTSSISRRTASMMIWSPRFVEAVAVSSRVTLRIDCSLRRDGRASATLCHVLTEEHRSVALRRLEDLERECLAAGAAIFDREGDPVTGAVELRVVAVGGVHVEVEVRADPAHRLHLPVDSEDHQLLAAGIHGDLAALGDVGRGADAERLATLERAGELDDARLRRGLAGLELERRLAAVVLRREDRHRGEPALLEIVRRVPVLEVPDGIEVEARLARIETRGDDDARVVRDVHVGAVQRLGIEDEQLARLDPDLVWLRDRNTLGQIHADRVERVLIAEHAGVEDDGVVVVHPVDAPPEVDAVVRVAVPGVDVRTVSASDFGQALVIRLRRVLASSAARFTRPRDEVHEELPVSQGGDAQPRLLPEGKLRPLDRLRLTRHQERIVDPHHDQVVDGEGALQSEVVAPDAVRPVEEIAL